MRGKVLLVGADTATMRLIASEVSSKKFDVQLAADAGEALAITKDDDIDVVILNFRDLMAEGIQLLRNLKKKIPQAEVITLSVPTGLRLSIEGMKLGVFEDIVMPFALEELVRKISLARERRKAKKGGRSLRQRFEDLAAAVSFAEAGDHVTARQLAATRGAGSPNSTREEQ
jgi:DNA-binding response OmpR family regulator